MHADSARALSPLTTVACPYHAPRTPPSEFRALHGRADFRPDRLLDPADRARLARVPAHRQRDIAGRAGLCGEPPDSALVAVRRTVVGPLQPPPHDAGDADP